MEEFIDFIPLPAIDYKILFSVSVAGIGILAGEFTASGALRFHLPMVYIALSRQIRQVCQFIQSLLLIFYCNRI